jgi:glycosyltransferase involved in cell wall biosynthesis
MLWLLCTPEYYRKMIRVTSASTISVIIPVYNGARYVAAAIDSVLSQTYDEREIIVIDDGSTDETAEVVALYPEARYIFQENAGIGAARNNGVGEARGQFLAFLDSDDLWTKDKLSLQMQAIQSNSQIDVLYGHVEQFQSPDVSGSIKHDTRFIGVALPGYLPGTMFLSLETFHRVGWFSTSWDVGEAIDWHLRATEQGLNIVMLPQVLLLRRLHESNQGIKRRDARTDYVRILKASLDRRRGEHHPGDTDRPSRD